MGLAIGLGVVVALVSGFWLARYHVVGSGVMGSDFREYCNAVGAIRSGDLEYYSGNRALMAGLVPGWLAGSLGIVDGLLVGSTIAYAVVVAGLYVWGRSLFSRSAGAAAALTAGVVPTLVAVTRDLSLYSAGVAGAVLCAAGATVAARWRTWPFLLAGASCVAIALLLDLRLLLWALPAVGLLILSACRAPWRSVPLRLALVLAPLALSFAAGSWSYSQTNSSLERQTDCWMVDLRRHHGGSEGDATSLPPWREFGDHGGFIWGRSPLWEIPDTLVHFSRLSDGIPASVRTTPHAIQKREQQMAPWLLPVAVALGLSLLGLARRPWLVLSLLVSCLPFAAVIRSAELSHYTYRQVSYAAPIAPLLLGIAWATLLHGPLPRSLEEPADGSDPPSFLRRWSRALVGTLLLALLVLGVIPSWLSPAAPWRTPLPGQQGPAELGRSLVQEPEGWSSEAQCLEDKGARGCAERQCQIHIREDQARGLGLTSRVYRPR